MRHAMSRKEKEAVYVQTTCKLLRKWGRKIDDSEFGDYTKWPDEELNRTLMIAREQLNFERGYSVFAGIVAIAIMMLLSYLF